MNHKQQTFITEYLRHRSPFTAYCLAYNLKDCSNYDSIMSSANRLLNHPEVNSVITSVLDGIRHEVEQELRAEMKTDMLTIQRKRELLAKIATGETYAVQNYKGKDCNMCTQHVWPTINQMLKAIDLDNKMVGLYTSLRTTDKQKAVTVSEEQVMQQVDKFIQSMGLTIDNRENFSLNSDSSFEGGAAGGGCSLAPEKSDEMATTAQPSMRPINIIESELIHNNIEVDEPQSGKSYYSEKIPVPQNCRADFDKYGNNSQQPTTISGGELNLVSPNHAGIGGVDLSNKHKDKQRF